jgi:hypothetical protein
MKPCKSPYTCSAQKEALIKNGATEVPKSGKCPQGFIKVQYFSGLGGQDFHYRREDADGGWSEKPSIVAPVRKINPKSPHQPPGDSKPYENCGMLCVPSPSSK